MKKFVSPILEKPIAYLLDHTEFANDYCNCLNIHGDYAVSNVPTDFVIAIDPFMVTGHIWPLLARSPKRKEASPNLVLGAYLSSFVINRFNGSVISCRNYLNGIPESQELIEGVLSIETLTVPA